MTALTVGSLFSGIGGLDLGLERAGMKVIWQSEFDPYASRVLAKHWPTVPNLGDITTIDWSTVERPDVICGGYPCQPFSLAGVRRGEDDPRHLWPHMRDAIRRLRPRWALLENVPGHLSMGFGRVLGDLAELGFDAEWECIPAAAVGAPHLRYRVFVIAHAQRDELWEQPVTVVGSGGATAGDDGATQSVADADGRGLTEHSECDGRPRSESRFESPLRGDAGGLRAALADPDKSQRTPSIDTEPAIGSEPVCEGDAGPRGRRLPGRQPWWDVEPNVGRVAHGVPSRVDRLRCLGNAVVPQVAEWVGRRIVEAAGAVSVTEETPQ